MKCSQCPRAATYSVRVVEDGYLFDLYYCADHEPDSLTYVLDGTRREYPIPTEAKP